jgi:uncharacterized protein (TIGR02145 family)
MRHTLALLAASVGLLAACSEINEIDLNNDAPLQEGDLVERVIFEAPVIQSLGEDDDTRASLSQEGDDAIQFGWEATDTVGIYPDLGAQAFFSMADGVGTNIASFDGGGWALRQQSTYSCYYPFVGNMYLKRDAIPVSFAHQVQNGVSNYEGVNFYLASEGTTSSAGTLRFNFQMLNTVIRIKAIGLPAGIYAKLTLTVDEPLFIQEGTYGLEDRSITGKTYSNTLEVALNDFVLEETSTEDNPVLIYLTAAPVDLSGKKVTIRAYPRFGNSYKCEKTPSKAYEAGAWGGLKCVMQEDETVNAIPEAVDLGLSVKWASFNLGAIAPEDYGLDYFWGMTTSAQEGQSYDWGTEDGNLYYNETDNRHVLTLEDDAANANLGDLWRMPTITEMRELMNTENCSWNWTTLNGVKGFDVVSKITGNSIFLPVDRGGEYACLWSSCCPYPYSYTDQAGVMSYGQEGVSIVLGMRLDHGIRPVYGEWIHVSNICLEQSELNMEAGETTYLGVSFTPENALEKSLFWSSSNDNVARVSEEGLITALSSGNAIITATSVDGEKTTACTVNVTGHVDLYFDEYGVNRGEGITINGITWAPVNCGYKPATAESLGYVYGKLYQWGRKDGQGYSAPYYDPNDNYMDEGSVTIAPQWDGKNEDAEKDTFYYGDYPLYNWISPVDPTFWNTGTEDAPVKNVQYDPCPAGWRVPTQRELSTLLACSVADGEKDGAVGRWFIDPQDTAKRVFFPYAGARFSDYWSHSAGATQRGLLGQYWDSSYGIINVHYNPVNTDGSSDQEEYLAFGHSVRCVADHQ